MALLWTVAATSLIAAIPLALFLRGRAKASQLARFLQFLRHDGNHAITRLTRAELGQWNARSRLVRRQFRTLFASEAAQEAADCGDRSLVIVSPDNRALLIAHEMEDHNWGFLELPRSSDLTTDDLFVNPRDTTAHDEPSRPDESRDAARLSAAPPQRAVQDNALGKRSMFLSHSHRDRDAARQLYHELRRSNVDCWFDEAEIKPGDSIIAKIEGAIDQFDYVGVVLTPNSVSSEWVKTELRMALTDQIKSARVRVIGLLLEDCELPGFLRDKLYIDFRVCFRKGLDTLVAHLEGKASTPELPLQGRLAGFVEKCGDPVWGQIGAHCSRQVVADLIRSTRREELVFILSVAKDWEGYKQWGDQLERKAKVAARTDPSTAKRLVRRIMDLGLIEPANDMDYPQPGGQWAYTSTPMLVALRNLARVDEVQRILRNDT